MDEIKKIERPRLHEDRGARQLSFRARQREKGLHLLWVSLEHLELVRAMVKAEKLAAAAEKADGGAK